VRRLPRHINTHSARRRQGLDGRQPHQTRRRNRAPRGAAAASGATFGRSL